MRKRRSLVKSVLAALGVITAISLIWRLLSRRHQVPCPSWAVPLLENPYIEAFAGSRQLLDRAGVRPGMSVLDVGCGPGRLALPAARRVGPAGEVVALDLQPRMIRKIEERLAASGLDNVRPVLAGAGEGRAGSGRYDRAFLVTVLGEIPDRGLALGEIFGVLKPGGVLSVTEVLPDPHYQSRSKVARLAAAVGFEQREHCGSFWAFTMNFQKPVVS